jgi:hypothetical protein
MDAGTGCLLVVPLLRAAAPAAHAPPPLPAPPPALPPLRAPRAPGVYESPPLSALTLLLLGPQPAPSFSSHEAGNPKIPQKK